MPDTNAYRDDELVAIGTAARILGVSVSTMRRWEADGHISAQRTPGNQRRYLVADLMRLRGVAA